MRFDVFHAILEAPKYYHFGWSFGNKFQNGSIMEPLGMSPVTLRSNSESKLLERQLFYVPGT